MFITQRFIKKLKAFLASIDYPYTDRYYPEIVQKLVYELVPKGRTIYDIGQLIKEYRYFDLRQKRAQKVFNHLVHSKTYQTIDIGVINNAFNNDSSYEKVIITNALNKGYVYPYNRYKLISTVEGKNIDMIKSGRYFSLNNSNYQIKTSFSTIELSYRNDLIMKYSMSHWGKKYRFKTKIMNDYMIDQLGDTFTLSRRNLDQQKEIIGKVEINEFINAFVPSGVAIVHVIDDTVYELMVMFAIGLMYSMIYAESSSRSAS